jgi:hypothetical protein
LVNKSNGRIVAPSGVNSRLRFAVESLRYVQGGIDPAATVSTSGDRLLAHFKMQTACQKRRAGRS